MTEIALQNERRLRLGFGIDAMKRQKVCPCCGTVCCVVRTRCWACDAALPKETLYEVYRSRHRLCGYCHAIVSGDASFCPSCGRKIPEKTRIS